MHARLLLVAAICLASGCADVPQGYEAPQQQGFDPARLQREMLALRTSDPDEIRRRWGDYELLVGATFVSNGKNPVEMSQTRWIVPGALSRTDWLNCYESTRKCDENWFLVQFEPAQKRLNFLGANGVAWAHGAVQPDGSVKVTRPGGAPYDVRFDYDADEGVFFYPTLQKTNRYIPTDASQYAEARRTWKQVDAETRGEERRVAQERAAEQAAQRRREEREADAERWNNINRAMAGLGQAYRETADQHRRNQADIAARNARLSSSLSSSSSTSSTPRTSIPNTSSFTRPQATTLAPAPLTPLPKVATTRTAPAPTPGRTSAPLKTNPLQPPRLPETTRVAPQQAQWRAPPPSTTTSAAARVEKPIGPPGTTITVPRREPLERPAPTVVASAPSSKRDNDRGRDVGTASTRDDPYRCITSPIEAKPVIGSAPRCKAFQVYNRCSAPVDIRTCVYLTTGNKKWSCELKSVAPNAYKQHESCLPHSERFVSVKYSDDHKTRTAMPPSR